MPDQANTLTASRSNLRGTARTLLTRFARIATAATALLLLPSCMTVMSQGAYFAGRAADNMIDPEVVIYGGLRNDAEALGRLASNPDPWQDEPMQSALWGIAFGIDLLLSAIADTVILPITVAEELHMRMR